MKSRIIKPEFWQSNTLRKCSFEARLLFIGLWNFCDDYGVCLNSNRKILGDVFPFEDKISEQDINDWKEELIKHKLIIPVEIESNKYLIVRSWFEHQKIQRPSLRRYLSKDVQDELMQSFKPIKEIAQPNTTVIIDEEAIHKNIGHNKEKPDKIKVRDNVTLSQTEIDELHSEYGKEFTDKCFDKLDNYKGATGRRYKSDYRAILNWVVSEIAKQETSYGTHKQQNTKGQIDFAKYERELKTEQSN